MLLVRESIKNVGKRFHSEQNSTKEDVGINSLSITK